MNNHESKSLKRMRIELDITQAELAKTIGYKNSQFISNLERGLCGLPLDAISKIGSTYGYKFAKLLVNAKAKDFAVKTKKYLGGIK